MIYTTGILTCKRSNWGSFSRPIQWWCQLSWSAVQISWHKGKIEIHTRESHILKVKLEKFFKANPVVSSNQLCSCTNLQKWRYNWHKLRYTPGNLKNERSNWCSFSRQIHWWCQISHATVQISWHEDKNAINWDMHQVI